MTNSNLSTIQDLQPGQRFHAKYHAPYTEPRILTFWGVSEVGGAFLVKWNGQVLTWLNPNAPIVLVKEVA